MGHTAIHDLLVAEIESFPFASPAAFASNVQALAHDRGVLSSSRHKTESFARDLEERLRPHAASLSLEALAQLRDGIWFEGWAREEIPLHELLARLSERYLAPHGKRITLRHDGQLHLLAGRFRWLSLLLPPDLLIAALAEKLDIDPPADRVSLVTPHVAEVLERPIADTHLHVGAAVSFSTLWTALMVSLGSSNPADRPTARELDGEKPPPFGTGKRFLRMLLSAAIGRTLLASFLSTSSHPGPFRRFLHPAASTRGLPAIGGRVDMISAGQDSARRLLDALDDLCCGPRDRPPGAGSSPGALTSLYRRLVGLPTVKLSGLRALAAADPLAAVWSAGDVLPETCFTRRALRHLATSADAGELDASFAQVFWQYQRVRCLTYRHLTQEPGVSGLDWFQSHFRRIGPLRKSLTQWMTASALEHQSPDLRLGALEARTTPARHWNDLWALVKNVADQARDHNRYRGQATVEVGLVLHFLKEREWGKAPTMLHADPTDPAFRCRYGRWFRGRQREASSITGVFDRHPEALLLLRGVDVASSELSMPTWPTVPLIAEVRRASRRAAARLAAARPDWHVPPIRVTYHAGEDYRRLVEGLRRMHELIEFGVLHTGDRIGHGLALGDAPERWAGISSVFQPAEDRLDDLLWELDRYGQGDLPPEVGRLEFARFHAAELIQYIYGPSVDVSECAEARRRRHDPRTLEALGFPTRDSPPHIADSVDEIVFRYLTEPGVFERGRRPVEVVASEREPPMLTAAQAWLRRRVAQMELTIESNPSSNLIIGSFLSVDEHPAFRLQPLTGSSPQGGAAVLVSVNVDDPVTFASRLADEYSHLYFALLRSGIASQDALGWLNQVRENGWRSRFTVPASACSDALNEISSEEVPCVLPGRRDR